MADWGYAPAILIFGDTAEGRAVASEAVAARGGRIAATLPIEQAAERLDSQIAVDLVILDIAIDHGPLLDQLLRRIEEGAAARRFSAVVTVSPELLDIAAARIGHKNVSLLVGRDASALVQAMNEGLERTISQLREPGSESGAASFRHLGEEMARNARELATALDGANGGSAEDPASPEAVQPIAETLPTPDATAIRTIIRARRLRAHFFGAGLFADPAWDILLDLTAARIEGRPVAVSSLCIAAAVPATTALRWIKQLTETGLLRRVADPVDGRRVFIELTDRAARTMTAYFMAVSRGAKV